ncbi:hypothetical protein [Nesterenkonia sp. CF4.4]|uniref:hypothetical protein n=1 Tax=Nesterenkonia sp. CF4.4 TaxID=3373079 RepID=UPI003EE5EC78
MAQLAADGADQLWAETGVDQDSGDARDACWYCCGGAGATVVGAGVAGGMYSSGDGALGAGGMYSSGDGALGAGGAAAWDGDAVGVALALALGLGLALSSLEAFVALGEGEGDGVLVGGVSLGEATSMAGPRS